VADNLPGLSTDAQRAIQFARSAPGIVSALTGMSNPAHVNENLGVAAVAPPTFPHGFQRTVIFPANGDLATLPEGQAVYLIRAREGQAYLGRTNILRRRLGACSQNGSSPSGLAHRILADGVPARAMDALLRTGSGSLPG
jgi:hypothetical protein